MASRVVASVETQRLRERVCIVPDGIGRLPATIDSDVLTGSIAAIAQDRKINITYKSARGGGEAKTHLLSPLGLVHKDGTIYLVGVKGLTDTPGHFPLHRISKAERHHQPAQSRDFNLQQYIMDSHEFSHVLDGKAVPLRLKLRVAPETMFHFRERPLSKDQKEVPPEGDEPWYIVTATVPKTILLMPFLISMGRWIEVLEPTEVRAEAAEWVEGMWAHYTPDKDRGR
jgi:predicted DNA-binding transcriptional regulator YafY